MKNILVIALASVFTLAGLIGVSMAGHHYHGYTMGMSKMTELDSDQNGKITFEEFSAPQMDVLGSAFKMLDTNKDEVIDGDEWNEYLKVHGFSEPTEG